MVNNIQFTKYVNNSTKTVSVDTSDYEENYTKSVKLIPSPKTPQNQDGTPVQNSRFIDLLINPERRLTVNGWLSRGVYSGDTATVSTAIAKKNVLRDMLLAGGEITVSFEDGSSFTNVLVDKISFKKLNVDAQENTKDGVAEYSVTLSMVDARDYNNNSS